MEALRNPLFCNLWIATVVPNIGTWMQDVGVEATLSTAVWKRMLLPGAIAAVTGGRTRPILE